MNHTSDVTRRCGTDKRRAHKDADNMANNRSIYATRKLTIIIKFLDIARGFLR